MATSISASDRERGLLSSVQRALRVLDVVSSAPEGITAKAVARRAGVNLSSTYHLLHTLVNEGYLVHLEDRHGFGLGYKIPTLYQRLQDKLDVSPETVAAVTAVHDRADAAAYYATFRGTEIVIVHVVDSPSRPRVNPLSVGFHESAHATAFGKVMLASLTAVQRRSYLSRHGMVQLTPLTVTDQAELEGELEQGYRTGVVGEVEEFQLDLACLAAPVRDTSGAVIGAIAVSVPAVEFEARRKVLEHAVRQGAACTTRAAGLAGVFAGPGS